MKSSRSARGRVTSFLSIMFVASLLSGLVSSRATSAERGAPDSKEPAPASTAESRSREAWSATILRTPTSKRGCFTATYPNTGWQEVPCTTAPPYPQPPRRGPRPETVGNGNDISAHVPVLAGFISAASGNFDSVTGVKSESGTTYEPTPPNPPCTVENAAVPNTFTLQLNTNFFTNDHNNVPKCNDAANPTMCQGWEQFVYSNSGQVFMQYWLLNYGKACPMGGWKASGNDCYKNSPAAPTGPAQQITNLRNLALIGAFNALSDIVSFLDLSTGKAYRVMGDNAVNAAKNWQIAEFNVVGDGCSSEAKFNPGSTIVPRTAIFGSFSGPPSCVAQGFTGETNNLSFGPDHPTASQPGPALIFRESSAGGASSNCAAATTVGDTHLATFDGLFYDFQASGEFVLAQVDPDFVVQTRQVPVPTWPNISVNNAVATRMGKTRVAICLAPVRLEINGMTGVLGEGQSVSLPDGIDISRRGNVYVIADQSGDSVCAEIVNASWINVSVGLGRWPVKVRGLLHGNINEIETRDGTVLKNPVSFTNLYHRYADSWRVPAEESMLCKDRGGNAALTRGGNARGVPEKPFSANNLDQQHYERARAICTAAGVKMESLLAACMLDVAVLGDAAAARVFVGAPAPIAVMSLAR